MTNYSSITRSLPAFITGFIDGIIVPLAIYCFFIRIMGNAAGALQVSMAAGIGIAILYATGAYFTQKAEMRNSGESQLIKIYGTLGISETLQEQMADDVRDENNKWQEQNQFAEALPALHYAILILSGFIAGLLVIAANSYINKTSDLTLIIIPLLALFIAGLIKNKTAGQNLWKGLFILLISGAVASISNWLIAGLF